MASETVTPHAAEAVGIKVNKDGQRRTLLDLLSFPTVTYETLVRLAPDLAEAPQRRRARIEADAVYAGYLDRQDAEIAALRAEDARVLPADLDVAAIPSLSKEIREKLARVQPRSLGQAGRIEGMTPAALAILASYARRGPGASDHDGRRND